MLFYVLVQLKISIIHQLYGATVASEVLLQKLIFTLEARNYLRFKEPEISSLYSQMPSSGTCPHPDESSPKYHALFLSHAISLNDILPLKPRSVECGIPRDTKIHYEYQLKRKKDHGHFMDETRGDALTFS
jgi:hypothetical protein